MLFILFILFLIMEVSTGIDVREYLYLVYTFATGIDVREYLYLVSTFSTGLYDILLCFNPKIEYLKNTDTRFILVEKGIVKIEIVETPIHAEVKNSNF